MADITGVLQEYVATANNPEYGSDWDVINSKFPELKDFDPGLLQEYVATANNPDYGTNWNIINGKFPEFQQQQGDFPADEEVKEDPSQEGVTVEGEDGASTGEDDSLESQETEEDIRFNEVLAEIEKEQLTEEEVLEAETNANNVVDYDVNDDGGFADISDPDYLSSFNTQSDQMSNINAQISQGIEIEEPAENEPLIVNGKNIRIDESTLNAQEQEKKDAKRVLEFQNKNLPEDQQIPITDEAITEQARKQLQEKNKDAKFVEKLTDNVDFELIGLDPDQKRKIKEARSLQEKSKKDLENNIKVNKDSQEKLKTLETRANNLKNKPELKAAKKSLEAAQKAYEANPTEETQAAYNNAYNNYKAVVGGINAEHGNIKELYNKYYNAYTTTHDNHAKLVKTDKDLALYLDAYGRDNSLLWGKTTGKLAVTLGEMGIGVLELLDKISLPVLVQQGIKQVEGEWGYDLGENGDALEAGLTYFNNHVKPLFGGTTVEGRRKARAYLKQAREGLATAPAFGEIQGLGDFGNYMADLAFNQAPNLALMYYTGGASLYAMGAVAAGQKFGEYEDLMHETGIKISPLQMYTAATLTGVTEALSEKITLGQMGRFKTAMAGSSSLKSGFSNYLTKQLFSSAGIFNTLSDAAQEGTSEMVAQLSSNYLDNAIGVERNPLEGVKESFWSGAMMSIMMFKAPVVGRNLYNAIEGKDANQKIGEKQARLKELGALLNNPDLAPGLKEKYIAEHQKVVKDINSIQQDEISKLDEMSNTEKKTILDIARQKYDLRKQQDEIANSNLDAETKASEIQNIKNEISKLDVKKNELMAPYYLEDTIDEIRIQADAIGGATGKTAKVTPMNAEEIAESLLAEQARIREDIAYQEQFLGTQDDAMAKGNIEYFENELAALEQADNQFGYISPQEDGGFEVIINKDKPMMGTAAHELMHAVLFKSIQQDPSIQDVMGDALMDHVASLGGNSSVIGRRMEAYGRWAKDKDGNDIFVRDSNFGEEAITVISEGIYDGTLDYNESFFNKIGNVVRRTLQNKLGRKVSFNTGRDVYNFIKDFNKSLKDKKVNKAIIRTAAEGAGGRLVEGKVTPEATVQMSKDASNKVQSIYEEQGEAGAFEIIEQFKPIVSRIAEKRREAPNFDKELLMSEIEIGERGILDLISKYDPDSGVPLAAYINTYLPARAIEASRRVLGEEFTEDVSERVDITAEEVAEVNVKAKPKKKKIILSDRLGVKGKVDKAIKAKLPELDIENLNFKTLKDQTPEITGEMFGISPKKLISGANITKKELQSAQMFINKNADVLISMLPEGATAGGTATGVPQTLLKAFYTKTDRAKMAKTGTKAGLAIQVKNDIKKTDFLETFGIIDGKPDRTDRNTSARVLALANQTGKMMTNQAVRQEVEKQGNVNQSIVLKLQDGKSSVMFSKAIPESKHDIYYAEYGDLVAEISNSNNKDLESIKNRVTNVFKDDLTKNEISKLSKEIFNNIKEYGVLEKKHVMPSGRKVIMPQTLQEFLIDKAVGDNLDYGVKEMLKKYLPKDENGKTINIGTYYLDKNRILKHRALPVDLGKQIVKEMGLEKGVEFILKYYKGMYAGASGIADRRYTFKNSTLIENTNYKPLVEKKGKMVPPKNRKQVFESVPDFVENVIGKLGVNVYNNNGSVKTVNQIQKDLGINTKLLAEKSESALKDMDFAGRKAQANEAKKAVIKMMDFVNKTEGYDSADVGMLVTSMGSGMTSVMRRAANFKYMGIGVENSKNPGKELEYEHMIPQVEMALKVLKGYLENGSVDNSIWEGYHVAIIPKTMDKVLIEKGFRSKSPVSGNRYYNMETFGDKRLVPIKSIDPADNGKIIGEDFVKASSILNGTIKEIQDMGVVSRAYMFSRTVNPAKGITVLDFDDTLATSKSLVISTSPDGAVRKLTAEEFAQEGADLLDQGWTHDFSEFSKVVDGKVASLFNKAMKLQGKFGPENMFVLTARPADSAPAIFEFLKANGLNIPLKNITGLANSTPEAKALWIADKVADGYNDFYFADDALQNVQAVDNMLEQFDVKRKVQQAKIQFSKRLNPEFNNILESTTGILSQKEFSDAQAKLRGRKTKYKSIIPASAQDFQGLLYNFLGKGKKGEADLAFFKKALIDPFARGIDELNGSRQSAANDFENLNKNFPEVKKILNKNIEGLDYTNDQAIRVYLWDKSGFQVPGLSKRDLAALTSVVQNNPEIQAYADAIGLISKKEDGYSAPKDYWLAESVASDLLSDGAIGDARANFLAEWQQNVDQIFSKQNLNKIQAIYGNNFREALEDSLYRMRTGRNRPMGGGRLMNGYMNWVNNSVGAIMFFNMRSAILQTISATNYMNWSFNNPAKAAQAFANQPQYWKDFSMIFNSPYLKQRRSGNQRGINEAELSEAVAGSDNKAKAAIAWLLKKGFLPTQLADSFAIASGGASFYRNKVKALMKEGMTKEQAEAQAFIDFQEVTEVSQQSARPDMISQQQASPLGRLILSFQNTPMQYARIMNKAARDLVNGRGDTKTHMSKIAYYGIAQGIIFGALQSALFAALGDDEEEDYDRKKQRILNQMIDSVLSGIGYGGKAISTAKNTIMEYSKQKSKKWNADHAYTLLTLLGFSPPIGSKLRKIYSAIQTEKFNEGVSEKRGLTLDNPSWSKWGNVIEGITNVPLGRLAQKMLNIDNALDDNNKWWERAALLLGWNTWDLGIRDKDIEAVKDEIKEEKKIESKKKADIKKEEKKKEKEEENKAIIEENKKKSKKDGVCSAVSKSGKRCKTKVVDGKLFCTVHESTTKRSDGKEVQCRKRKADGKRCKMKTTNKSGYCYYHD